MAMSRAFRAIAISVSLSVIAGCGSTGTPQPLVSASSASAGPAVTSTVAPGPGEGEDSDQGPESAQESALAALPANLRARMPRFSPPPAPVKVTLPGHGTAPSFGHIPTQQKIAFVTIDDGWIKDPHALQLFQAANVPITLFLEVNAIKSDPGYFTRLQAAGATIQNHTVSHPILKGRSYAFQKREICGGADRLAQLYGKRPVLFRPPGGAHDATTLRAAHDCGMKASFFWRETTDHGVVFYQGKHVVQPGDIVLMHFRKRFVDDFLAVLNAIHKAGLTPARLEDYIP